MFGGWNSRLFVSLKVLAVAALVLLASASNSRVVLAQDETIDPEVEAAVMATLQEAMDAFVAEDVERLSAVTADPFVAVDAEGNVSGREQWLTFAEEVDYVSLEAGDVAMTQLSPETVLVNAVFAIQGTYQEQEWSDTTLDSIVFVLRDGAWLMASDHSSAYVSDEEQTAALIASAISAAPAAIGEGATVVQPAPDGTVIVLQEGDNGFTCVPDDPGTEITDPICMDGEGVKMFESFMSGDDPVYEGLGIMYMLQGTAAASAADPMIMTPAEGEEWVIDGPNIRLVAPDGFDDELFPTEPTAAGPYIMWSGTPFEHLVIPVGDAASSDAMGGMEE
jgi:ketosteroid isomerase-like protein